MTPRHLLLVRHAKAAMNPGAGTDFDRPLAASGERDAERLADWLRDHCPPPDAIVSSPAARALATATRLTDAWETAPSITPEPDLYEAPLGGPARVAADFPDHWNRVVLVGHNPSLSHFADWLLGEPTILEMAPGDLAWLELGIESWHDLRPGTARLHAAPPL